MISRLLYHLYRNKSKRIRSVVLWAVSRLEKGTVYSKTMRKIFKDYHRVEIGMYTHGACFVPGQFAPETKIGRYCSVAANVRVSNRNHPLNFKSTHSFFFSNKKYCKNNMIEYVPLAIGNDVWFGDGAKIMPNVTQISDGAVIGAGAVVNKNVPPYAVVVGNPARVVRYRFSKEVIDELIASKWWEKDIEDVEKDLWEHQNPYEKLYFEREKGQSQACEQDAESSN